jgi:DNA-binding transcriptional MerR regulator
MKISEIAARRGVKAELIRYYERIGLIDRPVRSSGNYRDYTDTDAARLTLPKDCRDLGLDLDDLRMLKRLQAAVIDVLSMRTARRNTQARDDNETHCVSLFRIIHPSIEHFFEPSSPRCGALIVESGTNVRRRNDDFENGHELVSVYADFSGIVASQTADC